MIGDDRYGVVDAAEEVLVEYDPLPVVVDPEAALEDGSPLVHEQLGTNKVHEWSLGGGDIEAGFAEADVDRRAARRQPPHRRARRSSRAACSPSTARASSRCAARRRCRTSCACSWRSCSASARTASASIAPEVGGGFGSKLQIYAEEIAARWASRKLGRPVKWIETRSEGMVVTHHGRDQIDYVKVGAKRDGTLTALPREDPRRPRRLPDAADADDPAAERVRDERRLQDPGGRRRTSPASFTNKFPTDAIRGAGRPEATHMIEVMMDQLAAELGMDRARAAAQELHPAGGFPHETPIGVVYDSGDYHGALDKLLEHIDLAAFRRRAGSELRAQGKLPRHRLLARTWRSAASRRRASSARAASACRAALGVGDRARAPDAAR